MNVIWIVAAVLFAVAELLTFQFISIWFAVGALAAWGAALLGAGVTVQIIVFVLGSVLLFVLSKPIVKKLEGEKFSTNSDRLVGKTVIISQQVDNVKEQGRARISGVEWSVRSQDGSIINEGERAIVKEIQGVKLIVMAENKYI